MQQWTPQDIEKAVDEVRNAGGDVEAFTNQIAAENPNARTMMDDIQPLLNAAKQAVGYVEQTAGEVIDEVEQACETQPDCGMPPP